MTKQSKPDLYQSITDSIIALLESGKPLQWSKPWSATGSSALPQNALSFKVYRGINVLTLWAEQLKHGYQTAQWATYKQWATIGGQVRRGERATSLVYWNFFDKKSPATDGTETVQRIPFIRSYAVFNRDQIDGLPALPTIEPTLPTLERLPHADQFFASVGATLHTSGDRAFYRSGTDSIHMPTFDSFTSVAGYYSTLAHEHIHWTGSHDRLKRDLSGRFGSESYAIEELIAELGAAFICAHLGITSEQRTDHAAYIQNWLTVLRNDKHAIFKAATFAQQAADYLGATPGGDTPDNVETESEN